MFDSVLTVVSVQLLISSGCGIQTTLLLVSEVRLLEFVGHSIFSLSAEPRWEANYDVKSRDKVVQLLGASP